MMNNGDVSEPLEKKLKYDEFNLKSFTVEDTLNVLNREKVLIVKGKFSGSDDQSILIFEKSTFSEEISHLQNAILNDDFESKNIMSNDIYKSDHINGLTSLNSIKLKVISPATEKHIQKYSKPIFHIISETESMYTNITLPNIKSNKFSIKWIENLLNNKAENDRVLIQSDSTENGFVLVMDYSWDGKILDDLHCLAIVSSYDMLSLRDLNDQHLPLLREIMDKCKTVINTNYGIPKSQLRLYLHYPPSFYHLHVHITHVNFDSSSAIVDRAHLLSTVIRNIELKKDYYKEATLDISVNQNDALYELFKSNQCFE